MKLPKSKKINKLRRNESLVTGFKLPTATYLFLRLRQRHSLRSKLITTGLLGFIVSANISLCFYIPGAYAYAYAETSPQMPEKINLASNPYDLNNENAECGHINNQTMPMPMPMAAAKPHKNHQDELPNCCLNHKIFLETSATSDDHNNFISPVTGVIISSSDNKFSNDTSNNSVILPAFPPPELVSLATIIKRE
jgi:hypothetical protein